MFRVLDIISLVACTFLFCGMLFEYAQGEESIYCVVGYALACVWCLNFILSDVELKQLQKLLESKDSLITALESQVSSLEGLCKQLEDLCDAKDVNGAAKDDLINTQYDLINELRVRN